jgi:hypothetical protein
LQAHVRDASPEVRAFLLPARKQFHLVMTGLKIAI